MAQRRVNNLPAIRVSNTLIRNLVGKIDEKTLKRIDHTQPVKAEMLLGGVPIPNLQPLMHNILLIICKKITEKYETYKTAIDEAISAFAKRSQEEIFNDSFLLPVDLNYIDIYRELHPQAPKYSGGQIDEIADAIDALCKIECNLLFPARPDLKRWDYFIVSSTILHKEAELKSNSLFGREIIGARVRVSGIITANYNANREVRFVPTKAITTGTAIAKDDLTQQIYKSIIYNCGAMVAKAKKLKKKLEKGELTQEQFNTEREQILTYSESFYNLLNYKVKLKRYERINRFIEALNRTAENLKKHGVITRFYITDNSSGEKITNWVINENFSY